jgi:hypothetical protein
MVNICTTPPAGPAERMRRYRRWRREGYRYVRIPLHVMEIDDLTAMGHLNEEQASGTAKRSNRLFSGSSTMHWMRCAVLSCALSNAIGSR